MITKYLALGKLKILPMAAVVLACIILALIACSSNTPQIGEVSQVSAGYTHSLAVDNDGNLWAWGAGHNNQLGLGRNGSSGANESPQRIRSGASSWQLASAGHGYSLAIDSDGNLWTWGSGITSEFDEHYQVNPAVTAVTRPSTPEQVTTGAGLWQYVSAGRSHAIGIGADGSLWTWGNGRNGELGLGETGSHSIPQQITNGATSWQSASAGRDHSLAIDSDGNLWAWGAGSDGQLGLGAAGQEDFARGAVNIDQHIPQQVTGGASSWRLASAGHGYSLAIASDGALWAWGNGSGNQLGLGRSGVSSNSPQLVTGGADSWQSVSAGRDLSVAIDTSGGLWIWGQVPNLQRNYSAPYQIVDGSNSWQSVSTGTNFFQSGIQENRGQHTLIIDSDGNLWAWGAGNFGQLGLGNRSWHDVPQQVSGR
ncbi:MAG: hypothetical protein FWE48_03110 [Coriobacteriia bacterium]|nr:hypothetical protein [Coriobacteriia bacterium]